MQEVEALHSDEMLGKYLYDQLTRNGNLSKGAGLDREKLRDAPTLRGKVRSLQRDLNHVLQEHEERNIDQQRGLKEQSSESVRNSPTELRKLESQLHAAAKLSLDSIQAMKNNPVGATFDFRRPFEDSNHPYIRSTTRRQIAVQLGRERSQRQTLIPLLDPVPLLCMLQREQDAQATHDQNDQAMTSFQSEEG